VTRGGIDGETGAVVTDVGERIDSTTTRSEFLEYFGHEARRGVQNPPHSMWGVDRDIGGASFSVEVQFIGEALRLVTLVLIRSDLPAGWKDWSDEGEERRRAAHDVWLRDVCGLPSMLTAPWGRLSSFFDRRTCESVIVLDYVGLAAESPEPNARRSANSAASG
jgi:hypothetical protein